MKYILYGNEPLADLRVVVFANHISHKAMATGIQDSTMQIVQFISAGTFLLVDGMVFANGESDTLGLKSRPEDAEIITNLLGR